MRIWFDRLRLLRSSPASPTRRWLVRRGNQWLRRLLLLSTYREAPPFRHKAILIILQSITPGMTRIMHRAGIGVTHGAGVGVTHGVGDGLSEFPSDWADAGTAGSAAAFSVQACDASGLFTLASSSRCSDAPVLCMRVLVAVSVTAWAGVSTVAGTARPAHVRHPSCRFSRLQKEIAGRDDAERKKVIHRRSPFFRHSRVTRRGLPNPKGGAAQAIGLRNHDRHRTPGRAVQGGDHAIVVRSTRCWREMDSNDRFRGKRRRDGSTDSGPSGCCGRVSQLVYSRFVA